MTDIVEFMNARLDEDEVAAHDASWHDDANRWSAHPGYGEPPNSWFVVDSLDDRVVEVRAEASDDGGVARHIARYDPARVLAEVEAKRRILAEHEQVPADRRSADGPATGCRTRHNDPDCGETQARGLCETVRLLAAPCADHPQFKPEWSLA